MGMVGRNGPRRDEAAAATRELLDCMEADLRLLQGTVVVLRALSETTDSLEPIGLEALAHMTATPLERVMECWREASAAARDR